MRELNKETSLRQRILLLCDYYRISPNKLSLDAGYGRNFVSRMGSTTSMEFMIHIYRNFDKVNLEWLLTGNGKMLTTDSEDKTSALILDMLERQMEKNAKLEAEITEMRKELNKITASSQKPKV